MKKVVVYCGANKGNLPLFESEAYLLGTILAKRDIEVVYGGGSIGLMGVVADAVLAHGGKIKGVITHQLNTAEVGHKDVEDMLTVETMSERKVLLLQDTDGVITLAGGYGSMDELFEALCLAQLGLYNKPIGLLNTNRFYDPLLHMLDHMVTFGFLQERNRKLLIVETEIEALLYRMENFQATYHS